MRTKCSFVGLSKMLGSVACVLAVSFILVGRAHAVLRPYGYIGSVIGKGFGNTTIQIRTEQTWGSLGWETESKVLQGAAPSENAMNEIRVGDYVLATSLGAPGGSWITLARLLSSEEWVVTDIYGDPNYAWDMPLLGDCTIGYENTPDCDNCNGCNCDAKYATVTITGAGDGSDSYELYPGESDIHQDAHRSIDITFLSGQAPANPECSNEACLGPQPVSNFVIYISGETENLTSDSEDGGTGSDCFISTAGLR